METTPTTPTVKKQFPILKLGIIVLICGLLMIPVQLIINLIHERSANQEHVIEEVTDKWGNNNLIMGPYLSLPVLTPKKNDKGETYIQKNIYYVMPTTLKINAKADLTERKRSIYKVNLFNGIATINGNFKNINWNKYKINPENIDWNNARIIMNMNDVAAFNENPIIEWNNNKQILEPNTADQTLGNDHISSLVNNAQLLDQNFTIKLNFKGHSYLNFAPIGNETNITLTANNPNPSFHGKYLPTNSRIDNQSFDAQWNTISSNRPYPQVINNNKDQHIGHFTVGTQLKASAQHYQQIEKVIKYAFLFIALTFAIIFLFESVQHLNFHPLQYVLIGFAMLIFYSLLLSFSEYINFNLSYLIATTATVSLITGYFHAIFKNKKLVLGLMTGLICLYSYVFFLIRLQDYALIFGSIALFLVLAAIMYFTRNINWYQLQTSQKIAE